MGLACVLTAGMLSGCIVDFDSPIENENAQNPNASAQEMIIGRWHDRITDEKIAVKEDGTYRGNKKVGGEYVVKDEQTIVLDELELSFTVKGDFLAFYNGERDVTPPDYCVRVGQIPVTEEDVVGTWTVYGDPDYQTIDGEMTFKEDGTEQSTVETLASGQYEIKQNEDENNLLYLNGKYETEIVAAAGEMVIIDGPGKEVYFLVRAEEDDAKKG